MTFHGTIPSPLDAARLQAGKGASFIGGRYRPGAPAASFAKIHPGTGEKLFDTAFSSPAEIGGALEGARRAFQGRAWRDRSPGERRHVLLGLAERIESHAATLAALDTAEMGKTISDARFDAVISSALVRFYAEAIDKLHARKAPADHRTIAFNSFEPRGVVGAIVPWNYPMCNAVLKLAPALAAGNSVVMKPSEHAFLSTLLLAELATEVGLPDDVFNVVTGDGPTAGEPIAGSSDCDLLTFTGSHVTGRRIMELCARSNGKPLMMECGGKSAAIVMPDMADAIPELAAAVVAETFANQGQLCVARTRLLVHEDIAAALTEAVAEEARKKRPGDPADPATNFGSLVHAAHKSRVLEHIAQARRQGARAVLDAGEMTGPGSFVAPVVFDRVTPEMDLAHQEVFGPVLAVITFRTEDEAIAAANDSAYGLAGTVWARDYRFIRRCCSELDVGKLQVRSAVVPAMGAGFALGSEPVGQSGFGVEFGLDGLRSYSRLMSVEMVG